MILFSKNTKKCKIQVVSSRENDKKFPNLTIKIRKYRCASKLNLVVLSHKFLDNVTLYLFSNHVTMQFALIFSILKALFFVFAIYINVDHLGFWMDTMRHVRYNFLSCPYYYYIMLAQFSQVFSSLYV